MGYRLTTTEGGIEGEIHLLWYGRKEDVMDGDFQDCVEVKGNGEGGGMQETL